MRIEWRVDTVYAPDDDVPFLHEYVTKITKAYRPDLTVIPRFEHSDNGIVDMGKGIRILLPAGHWPVSPEVHEPILSEDWHELIYDSVTKRHELKTAELRLERGYKGTRQFTWLRAAMRFFSFTVSPRKLKRCRPFLRLNTEFGPTKSCRSCLATRIIN